MSWKRALYLASQAILAPAAAVAFGVGHVAVTVNLLLVAPYMFCRDPDAHPSALVRALLGVVFAFYVGIILVPGLALAYLVAVEVLGRADFFAFPTSVFGYRAAHYYVLLFGVLTVGYSSVTCVKEALWRRLGSRQPLNVPTSKARSAAVGLVELVGVARRLDGRNEAILELVIGDEGREEPEEAHYEERIEPFYLEDDTGRILIDPRGASIQPEWQAHIEVGVCEIVLTRHVEPLTHTDPERRKLLPGDPVYVIGNAQPRPDAPPEASDSERLVVKPLEPTLLSRAQSILPWRNEKRDIPHVFFLSDTEEHAVVSRMRRGLWRVVLLSALYAASGIVLVRASYDRALDGYASWHPREIYLDRPWLGAISPEQRKDILLVKLGAEDPRHRDDALRYLALLDDPRPIDHHVAPLLADPDAAVRASARAWLAKSNFVEEASYEHAFRAAARHSDPESRVFAVGYLSEASLPVDVASELLSVAFVDREPAVRLAAASESTHYIGSDPELLRALFRVLADDDEDVRAASWTAADSLEQASDAIGNVALEEARDAIGQGQAMGLRLSRRFDPDAPALTELASRLLEDSEPRVAFEAAAALPAPSAASVRTLRRLLGARLSSMSADERYGFRNDVLHELQDHGELAKAAIPEIAALVASHASEAAAFDTLTTLGEAPLSVVARALYFLESTTRSVRRNYALRMLREVGLEGDEARGAALEVLRSHRMSDARMTAAVMLGKLGARSAGAPDTNDAIDALVEALSTDPDEDVQEACLEALITIAPNDSRVRESRRDR